MGKRYVEGDEIVAKTVDGDTVKGKEVIIEDDDFVGKALLTAVTMGVASPIFLAGPDETRCVQTSDGKLHEVKEVIRRSE